MTEKQDETSDQDGFVWETRTSKNGKEFRVGYRETDPETENKSAEENGDAEKNASRPHAKVSWEPVKNSTKWIVQTNNFTIDTGITRYNLDNRTSIIDNILFRYRLRITNLRNYNYFFTDESGDVYNINTFIVGDHQVQYNSDDPTIKLISWRK